MKLSNDPVWPVYTPSPINKQHFLNAGRVLWLLAIPPLDGGSTWWDLCQQYDGTLVGMTTLSTAGWRAPGRSNGFTNTQYNGSSSAVTTGYSGMSGAAALTMGMWARRSSTGAVIGPIMGAYGSSNAVVINTFYYTDGQLYFATANANNGKFAQNDLNWHRVLYVYDGTQTGNAARLVAYLDGKAQTLTFGGTIPATLGTVTVPFQLGLDTPNGRRSNGWIDDVSVWNRPLSAQEAYWDYELSLLGYPDVLNRFRPTPTVFTASAPPTFSPAWASRQSVIGSGVY